MRPCSTSARSRGTVLFAIVLCAGDGRNSCVEVRCVAGPVRALAEFSERLQPGIRARA